MSIKNLIIVILLFSACSLGPEHYAKRGAHYAKKYGLKSWHLAEKNYDIALKKGEPLSKIQADYNKVLMNMATMYMYYKDYKNAEKYIDKSQKVIGVNYDNTVYRAILLIRTGKFKEGEAIISDLESQGYHNKDILYALATSRYLQKDYWGAAEYLLKIKDKYKDELRSNEIYYMLAFCYYQTKEYYQSLAVYNELLQKETLPFRKAKVAKNMATVYMALGNEVDAGKYLKMYEDYLKKYRRTTPRKWKKRSKR